MENRDIAIALHQLPGVGTGILAKIDQLVHGDWKQVICNKSLFRELKLSDELVQLILEHLQPEKIIEAASQIYEKNIQVVMRGDPTYPKLLAEIPNPPFLLYGIGDMHLLNHQRLIAIVGTRVPSQYGQMVAHKLAADLVELGWGIVSGMASGIDTYAHRGALAARGKTIAVLGCGVNYVYPEENRGIYDEICEKGLILSEYPPDMPPAKGLFPQRNRIISGLSRGVVIIESHQRSGSLITAAWAVEQGREVFAVPGSILSAKSAGPHQLIKEGAKLITSAKDIIDELTYPVQLELFPEQDKTTASSEEDLSREEEMLLNVIGYHQIHMDELIRSVNLSRSDLHQHLLSLEMKKRIKRLPGYYYVRN
jgi:DNA processing protein